MCVFTVDAQLREFTSVNEPNRKSKQKSIFTNEIMIGKKSESSTSRVGQHFASVSLLWSLVNSILTCTDAQTRSPIKHDTCVEVNAIKWYLFLPLIRPYQFIRKFVDTFDVCAYAMMPWHGRVGYKTFLANRIWFAVTIHCESRFETVSFHETG